MHKRGIILIILILSMALVLTGCISVHIGNGKMIVGNGQMETKDVSIEKDITGVYNSGSIDVVIDPKLSGEAVIEAESNIIDYVEITQDAQGSLSVSFDDDVNISLSRGVKVRIPAVTGGTIEVDGSGSITLDSAEPLTGSDFNVRIEGSGDIRLSLDAESLEAGINGSGDIDLALKARQLKAGVYGSGRIAVSGSADSADITIEGSGDFRGGDCAMQKADVSIAGSGNININVSSELTGSINGSGDVVYSGDPAKVSVSDDGSGDLIKR